MARKEDKNKAIKLRKQGMSYSQIKREIGISKGTLSGWLKDMPLSQNRILSLQKNEAVIEKIRVAKMKTRAQRLDQVFKIVSNDISKVSHRELFIAGFFLYWAEGGKTTRYTTTLSNTDPAMIRAFLKWVTALGMPEERLYIRLHLYTDMDEATEITYWSKELKVSKKIFKKSYVKKSRLSELTYITRGHGTCNVIVSGREISEYVQQGLKKIISLY
jgi:transcriptional regulator with XRE-family HTH domain